MVVGGFLHAGHEIMVDHSREISFQIPTKLDFVFSGNMQKMEKEKGNSFQVKVVLILMQFSKEFKCTQ